eukprot:s1424_g12.t1
MAFRTLLAACFLSHAWAKVYQGSMSMWASTHDTLVAYKSEGSACKFADRKMGGLTAATAQTPYITAKNYCAVNRGLFGNGEVCGRCYRLTYKGNHEQGRPGSAVVQIVDSGSWATFDCHMTAFNKITDYDTGFFPVSYEEVPCATASQGYWGAWTGPINGDTSFKITEENGYTVRFSHCFGGWDKRKTGDACYADGHRSKSLPQLRGSVPTNSSNFVELNAMNATPSNVSEPRFLVVHRQSPAQVISRYSCAWGAIDGFGEVRQLEASGQRQVSQAAIRAIASLWPPEPGQASQQALQALLLLLGQPERAELRCEALRKMSLRGDRALQDILLQHISRPDPELCKVCVYGEVGRIQRSSNDPEEIEAVFQRQLHPEEYARGMEDEGAEYYFWGFKPKDSANE